MEKGIVLLSITLSDPQGKYLIPVPMTLSSAGPEVWVAEAKALMPGVITNIPLNWKLRLPSAYLGLQMPLSQG